MADVCDNAEGYADLAMMVGLQMAQASPTPPIKKCYACEEPLPEGVRWCDVECRDDYEKQEKARKRNVGR